MKAKSSATFAAASLAAAAALFSLPACSSTDLDSFHHPTPASMGVLVRVHPDRETALRVALESLADSRGGGSRYVSLSTGRSNSLNWGDAWMVARYDAYASLRVGQLIIFRTHSGLVCHPIVGRDPGGFITAGTANARSDFGRVTAENYVARVLEVHTW
jgi:hypothetical protein